MKFSLPTIQSHIFKRLFFICLAGFFLALTFGFGFVAGKNAEQPTLTIAGVVNKDIPQAFQNTLNGTDFDIFWTAWSRLQEKFINKDKMDSQKMVYGAISGMVNSLGDPYTVFLPPQQSKAFKDEIKGSFGGIGAEIGIRKSILTIISPLKDSPAEKAKLLPKDQIIKINASSTAEMPLEEAVSFIRGPIGTTVTLTIFRDSFNEPKEFTITRNEIKIPTIKHESKGNGIYYIALYNFNEVSGNQFRTALQGFFDSKDKKLIIDLRNNPGGFLNMAVDIASFFTPAGAIIVREQYHDKT
ncbi:MAG: S41 family peptidase, partial [Patescibacteria group bacterium]